VTDNITPINDEAKSRNNHPAGKGRPSPYKETLVNIERYISDSHALGGTKVRVIRQMVRDALDL
jgi:hypothetical protein